MGCEHEVQLEHSKWLASIDARTKSNTHRIDDVEEEVKMIHDIVTEIRTLAMSMRAMQESIDGLQGKVERLERAEGEKLKEYTGHAIKILIGVLIGAAGTGLIDLLR